MSDYTSTALADGAQAPTQLPPRQLWIGGRWRDAAGGATYVSENPVDGSAICEVAAATAADVDDAVRAAQHAFEHSGWKELGGAERGRILFRAADLIEKETQYLSAVETLEVGKLYKDGVFGDIPAVLATFRYYAGFADKLHGSTVQLPDYAGRHRLNYTLREPLGVIGAITPWNNPIVVAGWKIAPALAAGNTVVIKPPEDAALSILRLAEILAEAGVPDGVFNVVPGLGEVAGAALAQHPGLAKLTFTGSPEVGALMPTHAGGQFRKVTLELGGKNPQIVYPDANLDGAMPFIAVGNFLHQGQVCAAGTRVYVHERLVDEVADRLVDHAKQITLGDPYDASVGMGPVINAKQHQRIGGYLGLGVEQGAELLTGGSLVDRPGYYVEPTVFIGSQDQRIAREEIFGPVATIIPFSDADDVLALANDSTFGLNAIIYTEDLHRAQVAARDLRVGNVWINAFGIPDMTTPWGGRAGSGVGRELGPAGIECYTEEKTVQMMF
ncbi:aldehyde dehydrogenase family protein [Nocardioides sp. zg-536]|uniref:Aldehyde dehydrogenase family protein n=1 Tax=Nocardioides faecalis TaxID=2803858 RepID=A0A938Y9Q4_9ACTN|nr:aldehyde dehydrogenase family protein [Nocardioides faecalis]MBM9461767.1 aldehyde dehydrogenase family protein [Nocardioides faecalis]MBS4752235.1 aldehyde dehydrogenase family protein [Nocardioides faecalis]QVI58966.1 aldehyde dehydrogenase family protein [Nocardioides faecalis]